MAIKTHDTGKPPLSDAMRAAEQAAMDRAIADQKSEDQALADEYGANSRDTDTEEEELLSAVGNAVAEPPEQITEFTDWRKQRLMEDQERLLIQVRAIDDEIALQNRRRTDAMLAVSGISADLAAMNN